VWLFSSGVPREVRAPLMRAATKGNEKVVDFSSGFPCEVRAPLIFDTESFSFLDEFVLSLFLA